MLHHRILAEKDPVRRQRDVAKATSELEGALQGGRLNEEDIDTAKKLLEALNEVKAAPPHSKGMKGYAGRWRGLTKSYNHTPTNTAVPRTRSR